jgi:predicted transcriptional regulator
MAKRGALPKYSHHHLVWALFLVAENKGLGRQRLAEMMGLGEGTCRGVLRELDENGLIRVGKSGISLSRRGKRMMEGLPVVHGELGLGPLALSDFAHGVAIRDHARFVRTGLEQRDAAMVAGAVGATALVFSRGALRFPDGRKLEEDYGADAVLLVHLFKPGEGDVIVVGYGRTQVSAESGAFAAAALLLFTPGDSADALL